MSTEYRAEVCEDCGWSCERLWSVQQIAARTPIPEGWRVLRRGGAWKVIGAKTRFTTLCGCPF